MAEFSIHHNANELVKLMGMEDEVDVESLAEQFQKSCQSNRPSSDLFLHKLEHSKTSEFKRLLHQLRSQNVLELDPLIQLLARISEEPKLRDFLRLHCIVSKTKPAVLNRVRSSTSSSCNNNNIDNNNRHKECESGFVKPPLLSTSKSMNFSTPPSRECRVKKSPSVKSFKTGEVTSDLSRTSNAAATTGGKSTQLGVRRREHRAIDKRSWTFLSFDYRRTERMDATPLSQMSLSEQENVLLHDLLHVLVGIEGVYIRLHPHDSQSSKKNVLLVDEAADKLLKTLADKIITICPLYSSVIHFVDENDSGLVNQALAAAMRSVLKDYFNTIAQLESHFRRGGLTMQTMWYYLQCWIANLDILKHFSSSINTAKVSGGAVLSILHNKTVGFKANCKLLEFCLTVTRDACVPYFQILDKWITEGRIDDPYNEFFIEDISHRTKEYGSIDEDSEWDSRYRLHSQKMPIFLSTFQGKILKAGKYLSVIREYGKEIESLPPEEPLSYSVEEKDYSARIETAYQSASRQLLGLLLHDADLMGHLQSIKHYFFMDQGDFVVSFMDMAEDELQKDVDDTNPMRLASLLELAIKTSTLRADAHHEKVNVSLMQDSLFKQLSCIISKGRRQEITFQERDTLKGFEAIVVDYDVEWPLNLILSEKNLTCYQMMFRHLFLCDYVERQLLSVWMDNRSARKYALKAITGYSEAFALRQKMLLFLHNRTFYMTVAVIEPHYRSFISRIPAFAQVDELAHEHSNFIDACLRDCMLSQEFALHFLNKLLLLCMSFAEFMQVSSTMICHTCSNSILSYYRSAIKSRSHMSCNSSVRTHHRTGLTDQTARLKF